MRGSIRKFAFMCSTVIVLFFTHGIGVDAFLFGMGTGFGGGGCGGGCCQRPCCLPPLCCKPSCCQSCTTTAITTTSCCRSCCGCCSRCSQTVITATCCTSMCGCSTCVGSSAGCGCGSGGNVGGCLGGGTFGAVVPVIGPPLQSGGCMAEPVPGGALVPYLQPPQAPPTLAPLSPSPQLRPAPYILPQQSLPSLGVLNPTSNVQTVTAGAEDSNGGNIGEVTEKSTKKTKSKTKSTTSKAEESEETEEHTESDGKSKKTGNEDNSSASNDSGDVVRETSGRTTNAEQPLSKTTAPKKTKAPIAFDYLYDDDSVVPTTFRNSFFQVKDISSESHKDTNLQSTNALADVFQKRSRFFEKIRKKSHRQFSAPSIADGKLPAENASSRSETLCNSYKLARIMVKAMVSDISISKRLIRKATEISFNDKKFDVFCASADFSYSIYAEQYCEATRGNVTCFAFT